MEWLAVWIAGLRGSEEVCEAWCLHKVGKLRRRSVIRFVRSSDLAVVGTVAAVVLSSGCSHRGEELATVQAVVRLEGSRIRFGEPVQGTVSLRNSGARPVRVCLSGFPVYDVRLLGVNDGASRYSSIWWKFSVASFVELLPGETKTIAEGTLFSELHEGLISQESAPPTPGQYLVEISVQTCQIGLLTAEAVRLDVVAD